MKGWPCDKNSKKSDKRKIPSLLMSPGGGERRTAGGLQNGRKKLFLPGGRATVHPEMTHAIRQKN